MLDCRAVLDDFDWTAKTQLRDGIEMHYKYMAEKKMDKSS